MFMLKKGSETIGTRAGFSSCDQLKEMLRQGWQIEPPVYVRPGWRSRSEREDTYHFILWRGNKVNLVSVADSAEVWSFLEQKGLNVDRL
jgi:hypothetical protein